MAATSAAGGDVVLPPGVRPLELGDPAELGGYRLVGRLGCGGMGVVYLGDDRHGRLVAVKTAHDGSGDTALRRRFRAEVACARRVPSTYTAPVLLDGTDRTPPYLVTGYVEGRSLEEIVEEDGPLAPEQLRALAVGAARALVAIHDAGVVHRDLKPANVLLTPTGPRVIDFGIAEEIDAAGGVTSAGVVMGSPGWIAPERLFGGPASPATDVFCWGGLVVYAATGRNAFGSGDPDAVAWRILHGPADLDGVDGFVRPAVQAALAKDPAERPSAGDLLARLSIEQGAAEPCRPRHGRHARTPRKGTLRRMALPAAVAVVVAAATLMGTIVLDAGRSMSGRPRIEVAPPTRLPRSQPHPAASGRHTSARPPLFSKPQAGPVRSVQPTSASAGHAPGDPTATARPGAGANGGGGQGLTGTAGRTVDGARTAAPTGGINRLLPH